MPLKRVIIDTDPGIDDTAAIFYALASGQLRVEMVTTVFGNADIDQTTRNACTILDVAGHPEIPVYRGAGKPLLRAPNFARHVHGENGLGDVPLEPPTLRAAGARAAQRIVEAVLAAPGELTLIALGPLTNVALALSLEPSVARHLHQLIIMGGAVRTPGNATPVASANLFNDPEAASIVYCSGAPIVQVGLDVCRPTVITHRHLDRIRAAPNRMAQLLTAITPHLMAFYERAYGQRRGVHFNDVPAVAYALDSTLFRSTPLHVLIETTGTLASGQTVPDWHGQRGLPPNAEVCLEVDAVRLADLFTDTLVRGAAPSAAPARSATP